jgi:hypothetical protein
VPVTRGSKRVAAATGPAASRPACFIACERAIDVVGETTGLW